MRRQYGHNTASSDQARAIVANDLQNRAQTSRKIEMGISAALIAIGLISVGASAISSANAKSELADTQKLIEEEKAALSDKEKEADDYKIEKNVSLVSAGKKGQTICNLQNNMIDYIAIENENAKLGEEGLIKDHLVALQQMKKELDASNKSSMFRSWCKYGKWTFKSDYSYVGEARDCVWSCYMPDDTNRTKPLMFVTGKYNPKTDNFTGLRKIYTRYYYEVDQAEKYHLIDFDTENDDPNVEVRPAETELPVTEEPIVTTVPFGETEPAQSLTLPYIDAPSSETEQPAETTVTTVPSSTETTTVTNATELEFYYSWSSAYGCWGYFDSNGNFYTEEEYEGMVH